MDVNTDGVVSAGDVSQINLRTVSAIDEFMQSWNYSVEGISTGQLSKDWLFIKDSTALTDQSFQISSTYPGDDGIGFSRWRVPKINHCITVPEMGSCVYPQQKYIGTMLGDIDGNYQNIAPDGLLKSAANYNGAVVLTIDSSAVIEDHFELRIAVEAEFEVMSMDLSLNIDEYVVLDSLIQYQSNLNFANWNFISGNVKITVGSLNGIENYDSLVALAFHESYYDEIKSSIVAETALINNLTPDIIVNDKVNSVTNTSFTNSLLVDVYPNPVDDRLTIVTNGNVLVRLMNLAGKVQEESFIYSVSQQMEINVEKLPSGVYLLQVYDQEQVITRKIVINHLK
jgi:hypothetical protein